MQNERPLDNPHIQEALDVFHAICERYDLAGGVYFTDATEMGFTYHPCATWNAHIADASLPLGFRIRARERELGPERAKELLDGSGWVIASMHQFGHQTKLWAQDLRKILKDMGMTIQGHFPTIPRLGAVDMRQQKRQ